MTSHTQSTTPLALVNQHNLDVKLVRLLDKKRNFGSRPSGQLYVDALTWGQIHTGNL